MRTIKAPKAQKISATTYRVRVAVNGQRAEKIGTDPKALEKWGLSVKSGFIKLPKPEKSKVTVNECITKYIESRSVSLSPSTIRCYKNNQKKQFGTIAALDANTITREQLQHAINIEAKKCSPKTLKNAWGLLSASIKFCTGRTFEVFLPTVVPNEHEFLQPEQIGPFLSAIEGQPVEIPALLGLHGLRRSEIMGLRGSDVDLSAGNIYVRGASVIDENGALVNKPENKNKSSRRVVPIMIPRLTDILKATPDDERGEFIVSCYAQTIGKQVNRICQDNGLPQIGTHGLRHSFCSLAYHLGLSEKATMALGGWSDYQTMRKIYTHIGQTDLTEDAKKMSEFFLKTRKS